MRSPSTEEEPLDAFARRKRAEDQSDASIMLALAQRGATAGEAEAIVRSLGGSFTLSSSDQADLQAQQRSARGLIISGIALIGAGVLGTLSLVQWKGIAIFGSYPGYLVGATMLTGLVRLGKGLAGG